MDAFHTDKQRLEACTFIKTVLMLLVVAGHSARFWGGEWLDVVPADDSVILCLFEKWLTSFHIYGFTLISGYLFYAMRYEKGKYRSFSSFVKLKARRLLIPYYFVTTVWVLPVSLIMGCTPLGIVKLYLGAADQLWFLWMIFLVQIGFWVIADLCKNRNMTGCIISLVLLFIGTEINQYLPNILQIFSALRYVFFFWMGFKLRQNGNGFLNKIPSWLIILLDAVLFWLYISMQSAGWSYRLLYNAVCIVGALMSYIVLQRIAVSLAWKKNKQLAFLSEKSMPIYLFHQQFVYAIIMLLNGLLHPIFISVICFAITLTLSAAVSSILLKNNTTRSLLGEKTYVTAREK